MIPQTAIVQIAKKIGRELNSGAEPSEDALAAGPILAEAGATPEIVGQLLAEAQRNRPNDRMIHAYAFMLEGALETLRVQASGGDVAADDAIAAVHKEVADNLRKSSIAPDVLMLVARAFARAELDPGTQKIDVPKLGADMRDVNFYNSHPRVIGELDPLIERRGGRPGGGL